ncbi:MAG: precorrin-3B C(17)-methyltransferase [Actinomycetota bacterium]|nr:precorrin-3B C(17)-methyltransferase [Actinomycetota bacterium]
MRSIGHTCRNKDGIDGTQNHLPEKNHGSCRKGKIFVGGLGPGCEDYMVLRLASALKECNVIVGYKKYISLLNKKLLESKMIKSFAMGQEIERANFAVNEALKGSKVMVVSSGDPVVYGMAGLVLDKALKHDIEIEIIPGITAALGASALLGSPLTCDFAVISLSDLLVPWEQITYRLENMLKADVVVALYNPSSTKRQKKFLRAVEIIEKYRHSKIPLGVVRNAYREGQEVKIMSLHELKHLRPDMNTVILIGNSQTKIVKNKMINPRGYK